MTDKELMQQTLYTLEHFYENGYDREDCFAAITTLLERLTQPVQEPVRDLLIAAAAMAVAAERQGKYQGAFWVADAVLETSVREVERPEQEPVAWLCTDYDGHVGIGITKDAAKADAGEFCTEFIPLYTAPQPAQHQEPVAMRYDFDGYGYKYIDSGSGSNWQTRIKDAEPLYAAPVQRQWDPIETAPKDGTEILLISAKGRIANGMWVAVNSEKGYWFWPYVNVEPNGWKPLYAAQQPVQEPVAWNDENVIAYCLKRGIEAAKNVTPPRQWVGLTDEEVSNFVKAVWPREATPADYIRAIEVKLKEKNA